jgi:fermentation-respiration switch protein FrsA (DUF1100 family)
LSACAYSINATMTARRAKAVASVTGVNFGRLMREGFSGYDPLGSLETMAKQRTAEMRGGKLRVDNILPPSPEEAERRCQTEREVFEATDYYRTPVGKSSMVRPAAVFPRGTGSLLGCLPLGRGLLTQPLMVVIGDKVGSSGAYRDGMEIYGRARSEKKELVVLEGLVALRPLRQARPGRMGARQIIPFFKE